MQAMVFAAGLGTRLAPLTDSTPKCLVDVGGAPMIELVLRRLVAAGVDHVVVNTFHEAEQVHRYFAGPDRPRCRVSLSDETELLDTGGGLRQALPLFDPGEPILVHNCDVVTDANLVQLVDVHRARGDHATLLTQQRPTRRALLFDPDDNLRGRAAGEPDPPLVALGFGGVHVISPALFPALRERAKRFSITDFYLEAADSGHPIRGLRMDHAFWTDLGTPDRLARYRGRTTKPPQ